MTVLSTLFFFFLQKSSYGQALLERAFTYLDILERDYFGMKFIDGAKEQWLDPKKEIKKQSRGMKGRRCKSEAN